MKGSYIPEPTVLSFHLEQNNTSGLASMLSPAELQAEAWMQQHHHHLELHRAGIADCAAVLSC
jgi:hypothetical protein